MDIVDDSFLRLNKFTLKKIEHENDNMSDGGHLVTMKLTLRREYGYYIYQVHQINFTHLSGLPGTSVLSLKARVDAFTNETCCLNFSDLSLSVTSANFLQPAWQPKLLNTYSFNGVGRQTHDSRFF